MGSFVSKDETSLTTSINVLTGCTVPASGLAGDLLVGIWGSDSTQTATLDAAYTAENSGADGACRAVAFSKIATGLESGDISLNSAPTANRQAAAVARYRGYTAINHLTVAAAVESGTDNTHASPNITVSRDGAGIVLLYAERVTNSALPITPPAGFQPRASFATGGNGGVGVAIADKLDGNEEDDLVMPGDWLGTIAASAVRMVILELLPPYPAGGSIAGPVADVPGSVTDAAVGVAGAAGGARTLPGSVTQETFDIAGTIR